VAAADGQLLAAAFTLPREMMPQGVADGGAARTAKMASNFKEHLEECLGRDAATLPDEAVLESLARSLAVALR